MFISSNFARSVINTVVLTTFSKPIPWAPRTATIFCRTRSVCREMSSPTNFPVAGSNGIWPEQNTNKPAAIPWEYGPIAAGASVVEITVFMGSVEGYPAVRRCQLPLIVLELVIDLRPPRPNSALQSDKTTADKIKRPHFNALKKSITRTSTIRGTIARRIDDISVSEGSSLCLRTAPHRAKAGAFAYTYPLVVFHSIIDEPRLRRSFALPVGALRRRRRQQ